MASPSRWQRASIVLLGFASVFLAVEATALGLGPATVASGLGEPLRMSIPVTLQPDEDIGCVQVRPHGDDLPSVFNTRSQVLRSGPRARIEIQSAAPVDEPAIGLIVSVGCASPIARDYVLFLDPPVFAATTSADAVTPSSAPIVTAPGRRGPRVRQPQGDAARSTSGARNTSADRPARPARRRAPTATSTPSDVPASAASTTASAAGERPRAAAGGDRLSVMPTEPPVIGRTSPAPQPGVYPPAVAGPAATGATGVGGSTVTPPAATAADPSVSGGVAAATPSSTPDADAVAHEQALEQQQVALQSQIKSLSDQIAALRVQATSMAARNQSLEGTAFTPTLVWLLIALAVIAIIVAGWMAWRYTQLRRSLEGSAWWTSHTAQDGEADADASMAAGAGLVAPQAPPRPVARPVTTPVESPTPSAPAAQAATSAQISNIDRIKPAVRAPGSGYRAAMDTDFTVSDIEAAMATVRTVAPARAGKQPNPLEDSDFAGLGGPTITSPFSDTPPNATPATPATEEEMAHFVDLDIPPIHPLSHPLNAAPPSRVAPPSTGAKSNLDFKFEMPDGFDPLATDSLKTTVIDRPEPEASDFDMDSGPTALDFELPSQTQILAMTPFDRIPDNDSAHRGGATLDDLFAPTDVLGPDTILELDDVPLSSTEIDRLTSPQTERSRIAHFADLLTRLDEIATTDPLRTIAHLRHHVLRDEHVPTLFWLRLFELYKVVDKRQVHDALAEHFARRYHRPMVGWNETLADRTPQRPLSALAEIDREIEAQWGKADGVLLLEKLLCDRTQDDAIVFNAVLQRDLLDAAKIFPAFAEPDADEAGSPV